MNKVILNKDLNFRFNPFGGLSQNEISQIIVPKKSFQELIKDIESEDKLIIQLVGFKGRGKTTHLRFLNELYPQYPFFYLDQEEPPPKLIDIESDYIFVDSIHHLPFSQRIAVYKKFKKVILTTHLTRAIEYLIVNKKYQSYSIKGIQQIDLTEIIKRRIRLASSEPIDGEIRINEVLLNQLIKKYKDNIRGILYELYQLQNQ